MTSSLARSPSLGRLVDVCRVVSVDIRDDYEFMDEALVALLLERVPPLLR